MQIESRITKLECYAEMQLCLSKVISILPHSPIWFVSSPLWFVTAAFCTSKHPTTVKNTRQIITFLPKLLHNSNKSRTFAPREPAKPLNDAQMCGSFYLKPSFFSSSTQIQTIIYSSPTDTNVGEFTNKRQENNRQRS